MNRITKISATQFNLKNKALEILISGCTKRCSGCNSPELQDFNFGFEYYNWTKQIYLKVLEFDSIVENVWITGGEPLDNNVWDIWEIILHMPKHKKIWLFTSYELEEVPLMYKVWCDYIKCGCYKKELIVDDNIQYGVKLSTSNQNIYKKGMDY